MGININVKRTFKIRINGKEYASPDEMPPDVRETYERMMAGTASAGPTGVTTTKTRINFNGTEYELDTMPPDVRRLYEKVLKAAEGGGPLTPADIAGINSGKSEERESTRTAAGRDAGRINDESSFSARKLILSGLVFLLLALAVYLYIHR